MLVGMAEKTQKEVSSIDGHVIPPPRWTRHARRKALMWVGLPLTAGLFLVDGLLFLLFRYGFDSCYGVFCLL